MRKLVAAMALGIAVGGLGFGSYLMAEPATASAPAEAAAPALPADQAKVAAEIEKAGGRVDRDEKAAGHPVIGVILRDTEAGDAILATLKVFKELQVLDLAATKITDAGIDSVKDLSTLTHLIVSDTPLTDASLAKIKALTKLTLLDISRTKATDKGVKELQAALPKCQIDWIFDNPDEPKEEKKEMK